MFLVLKTEGGRSVKQNPSKEFKLQFFDEEKNSWVESSNGINGTTEKTTGKRKKRSNTSRNLKRKRDSETSSVVSMDFSTDSSSLDATIQENESIESSSSTEGSVTSEVSSSSSTLSNFRSELRPPSATAIMPENDSTAITSTPKLTQPIEVLESDEEDKRPTKRTRLTSSGQ